MKKTALFLLALGTFLYADAPWQPNIRVSVEMPWDTLDQGESCFDIFGDSLFSACNTAQRGQDPNDPFAYSLDNGQSFIQIPFVDDNAGSTWLTDPIVGVDDSGHVHMIIQFSADFMNHYFSRDGGLTWSDTSRVNSSSGVDKPWWVIDKNEIYVTWQQTAGQQGIWLAKSTDYGRSFSDSRIWERRGITAICMDEDKNLHLANVVWGDGIYYRKSTDKGVTWSTEKRLAGYSYQASYGDRAPINSITATGNAVFITWVDNNANDSWEVNAVRSTDGGSTWGSRFIVNEETAGGQCKGWAHFDRYGGLHVMYYHTPDWPTSSSSIFSVRYQFSQDSGATFYPSIRITDTEWSSHADFMGEYHILRSDSQFVYAVWADGRNPDDNDLYFSKALISDVTATKHKVNMQKYPKFLSASTLCNGSVIIKVSPCFDPIEINAYDVSGRIIKKLYAGKVTTPLTLRLKRDDLSPGIIFLKVKSKNLSEVKKIIKIN